MALCPLILPYRGISPRIDPSCFIAPGAGVIGDVVIGPDSGIWFGCTLRGDVNGIRIGARTNIQDNSVVHVSSTLQGTFIGDDVTVGHMALLHACTVGNRAFIGMQACVMDGACIEDEAMVAAGALVTPGKRVPARQLWGGRPAKFMRALTDEDIAGFLHSALHYADLARTYRKEQETPPPDSRR